MQGRSTDDSLSWYSSQMLQYTYHDNRRWGAFSTVCRATQPSVCGIKPFLLLKPLFPPPDAIKHFPSLSRGYFLAASTLILRSPVGHRHSILRIFDFTTLISICTAFNLQGRGNSSTTKFWFQLLSFKLFSFAHLQQ